MAVWARATFFLADLLETKFENKAKAVPLLRELAKRAPDSEYTAFARSRLAPPE